MITENQRLTHKKAVMPMRAGESSYWTGATKDKLMERLAAYEDTDLGPEEILKMKEIIGQMIEEYEGK